MVSTELNRQKAARNIIRFLVDNNLDGVDFDWEYPGATDIDGTPPGSFDEGENYLKFLRTVRKSLPAGKSLSIAAPSSFWYLKNFPIKAMSEILDYIIYMTYDLHGQWDAGNKWTSPGCPTGNCLRHHTNKTEVDLSLALITKAGAPSNMVVVGMPLYGRSFKMAQAGCTGPNCFFLGERLSSQAAKGVCTGTAGYISNMELRSIQNSNTQEDLYGTRMIREIDDKAGDIIVYDDTEWVSWMKPKTYILRTVVYRGRNFGGTSDWAIDLDYEFEDNGNGGQYDADDEDIDGEYSCDYDRTFTDLDDLDNNAGGLSLFCRQIFAIQVLEDMLDNLYAEYQSADNGYDAKFDAYTRYINRITPYAINNYMTEKGGLNFFDCSMKPALGPGESRHCADFSEAERNEGHFNMDITLRDREGFFTDLLNDTGVAEEWINFNGHERDIVYCQNPGSNMCPPTSGVRDWYGWPAKNDEIEVANPKEVITESMGSIDELKLDIMTTKWDIISGMWGGDVDDVVQVLSVPVFMLAESVEGMKQAKQMGEDEEKWEEEEARNKAKSLILTIIGAALFIVPFLGQLGATLAGAATLARFALIAGEVANTAFTIYGMIDDPNSAVMGVLGMMYGLGSVVKVGRNPKGFRDMAVKRADLRTSGGVSKIGGMFQKRDDTLQRIIKLCR